jgi:hypothetical protein
MFYLHAHCKRADCLKDAVISKESSILSKNLLKRLDDEVCWENGMDSKFLVVSLDALV